MVVLHIANITPSDLGGVRAAVPQMVAAQARFATVGFINTRGLPVPELDTMLCEGGFSLDRLEKPFNNPDLVVFHEVYRPEFISIAKQLKNNNVPYIVIPHGCLTRQAQARKRLKKILGNLLLFKKFVKNAVAVQYLSENESKNSSFRFDSFVCGNGIDIPDEKKCGFSSDGLRIVFIGRLEIITKGLDLLLSAVKECRAIFLQSGTRIYIYGPDTEGAHEQLRGYIKDFNLEEIVTVGSSVVGEEKKKILLSADYFLLPSRTEGMPMGVLEALGYGLPCLLTEGTGMAGMISSENAGFGCETSEKGIGDALRRAIESVGQLNEMSENASRLAKERFDKNTIAAETVEIYGSLVGR